MAPQPSKRPAPPPRPEFSTSAVPDFIEQHETSEGETLFLGIPLGNGEKGGTAVYMPGRQTGPLDMLVYFHGNKAEVPQDDGTSMNVAGKPLVDYMKVPQYNLRAIIQKAHRRNFVLVVPSLTDGSKAPVFTGSGSRAGANFDTFLEMVLSGIAKHASKAGGARGSVGGLVLAGHSGGGTAMGLVAANAPADLAAKVAELWCFDCLYGCQGQVLDWIKRPGNRLRRAWVYCTHATSGNAGDLYDAASNSTGSVLNLEISLPPTARSTSRRTQNWRMGLDSPDHWKCVGTFLPTLLDTCYTLGR